MNNYKEQLNRSLSETDKEWWGRFFPHYNIDWDVTLDMEYKGIDCIMNNKKIQLKLREKFWSDILIEFAHTNGEKGWINKNQECEYIVFGWREKDYIYIFEWRVLREFWKQNQVKLFQRYGNRNVHGAINKNKITFNFSIPFNELPKHNKIYEAITGRTKKDLV